MKALEHVYTPLWLNVLWHYIYKIKLNLARLALYCLGLLLTWISWQFSSVLFRNQADWHRLQILIVIHLTIIDLWTNSVGYSHSHLNQTRFGVSQMLNNCAKLIYMLYFYGPWCYLCWPGPILMTVRNLNSQFLTWKIRGWDLDDLSYCDGLYDHSCQKGWESALVCLQHISHFLIWACFKNECHCSYLYPLQS